MTKIQSLLVTCLLAIATLMLIVYGFRGISCASMATQRLISGNGDVSNPFSRTETNDRGTARYVWRLSTGTGFLQLCAHDEAGPNVMALYFGN